ncbi:unnamed protein product [Cuscuta campestris]|uniref:Uncharacterized protein n=1 Tax=Cuscuta campestris TaxID=132261 RepID=A0A484LRW7_9ASTE|nr:unnamed protein product [Cuscuta campestris]
MLVCVPTMSFRRPIRRCLLVDSAPESGVRQPSSVAVLFTVRRRCLLVAGSSDRRPPVCPVKSSPPTLKRLGSFMILLPYITFTPPKAREERHRHIVRTRDDRMDTVAFAARSDKRPLVPNRSCSHCGRTNHTVDTCFELIGFPAQYARGGGRGRGSGPTGRGGSASGGRGSTWHGSASHTPAGSGQPAQGSSGGPPEAVHASVSDSSGHLSDQMSRLMSMLEASASHTYTGNSSSDWLIDSGASHHMTVARGWQSIGSGEWKNASPCLERRAAIRNGKEGEKPREPRDESLPLRGICEAKSQAIVVSFARHLRVNSTVSVCSPPTPMPCRCKSWNSTVNFDWLLDATSSRGIPF